jgi:hypothetical protein
LEKLQLAKNDIVPEELRLIRRAIDAALSAKDKAGIPVGNYKWGVYAFYDYDSEPIYVGKTNERLSTRVRRHLTNQRSDAVAMGVLDPMEVAKIELWPLPGLQGKPGKDAHANRILSEAEFSVFQKVIENSEFKAVLNEKPIPQTSLMTLPESYWFEIVPDGVFQRRKHPDLRIARRTQTIAKLAGVISERAVTPGLRSTLVLQARRLEALAKKRLEECGGIDPAEGQSDYQDD